MLETCRSCGTVFDIDENILSKKIRWLRCSVCNEKWSASSIFNKKFDKSITKDKKNLVSKNVMFKNKSVLITGGTGSFGKAFLKYLIKVI